MHVHCIFQCGLDCFMQSFSWWKGKVSLHDGKKVLANLDLLIIFKNRWKESSVKFGSLIILKDKRKKVWANLDSLKTLKDKNHG